LDIQAFTGSDELQIARQRAVQVLRQHRMPPAVPVHAFQPEQGAGSRVIGHTAFARRDGLGLVQHTVGPQGFQAMARDDGRRRTCCAAQ
jgi:hypothetical protein